MVANRNRARASQPSADNGALRDGTALLSKLMKQAEHAQAPKALQQYGIELDSDKVMQACRQDSAKAHAQFTKKAAR